MRPSSLAAIGLALCSALFGIPRTWAASSGLAWLVAGSFQTTVLAGPLLAPLIYRDERRQLAWRTLAIGAVMRAAFAYPLGNRKLLLRLVDQTIPEGGRFTAADGE
jgi:hypothetical protein